MRAVALVLVLAAPAAAQSDPRTELTYPLGQRVRVSAPAIVGQKVVGRVAMVDSNHLALSVSSLGSVVAIPYASIAEVRASHGKDRRRSGRLGALVGLGLGAFFFATTYPEIRESDYWGFGFLSMSIVSFGIAPGLGAVVGYAAAPERWEELAIPAPRAQEPAGVSIRFAPNEHVRLRTRDASLSGRVVAQTRTLVTVSTNGGPLPVPWSDVTRVQIRGGKDRVKGAAAGALLFIGLGILGEQTAPTTSTGERIGAFTGAAAVGGYLGSHFLAPRGWADLPVPGRTP